jgi:DNA/RNA-binding domain of Phe-tRNA-synthetase-like protein
MHFGHSSEIWRDYPELVPGVLYADGIGPGVAGQGRIGEFTARAAARLAGSSEAELPEIKAWRGAFARMGLKPTQYRCASESLLRRYRKEGSLPRIHPLVDLCNAVSLAFAIPVAVLDVSRIAGYLEVRYADGDESYQAFSGAEETPEPREVIFADAARRAHARRWTNRQSAYSAMRDTTAAVLIVTEAMHDNAAADIPDLTATIAGELRAAWSVTPEGAILSSVSPRFTISRAGSDNAASVPAAAQPDRLTRSAHQNRQGDRHEGSDR